MNNMIKVLVVDDSAFMRKAITEILSAEPSIEVVGTARNGEDALAKVTTLTPDVLTLDIEMPVMDGLTVLERLMQFRPMPVVMLSSLTASGSESTLKSLELGAFDFVQKPSGQISLDLYTVKSQIIEKIKAAVNAKNRIGRPKPSLKRARPIEDHAPFNTSVMPLTIIGASTGGPQALSAVFEALPGNYPTPILVIQHMPAGFTKTFADRLDRLSKIHVVEAKQGMTLETNTAYVAPGGRHMEITKNYQVRLTDAQPVHGVRPSVDVTMMSLKPFIPSGSIAVILTGMGQDGAAGIKALSAQGVKIIAEDEKSCVVFGMPKAAIQTGCVNQVLPLDLIPRAVADTMRTICKTAIPS